MNDQTKPKWVPPYIAFPTLTGLIERMQTEGGPPARLDRSYLDKFSGGYQSQVLAALRSLGLMGPNGEVQPTLTALVDATDVDARKGMIAEVLRAYYPKQVILGTTKSTQGQLEESFREDGITGDTLRKAIAFYLAAARYAGVPVSTNFKVPSVTRADGRGRKPRRLGSDAESGEIQQTPPNPNETANMRKAYFDMLLAKAEASEQLDTDLLDRIEKLMSVEVQRPPD